MARIQETDSAYGALFTVEGDRTSVAEQISEPTYLDRLRAIVSGDRPSREDALRALVRLGTDWVGGEHGYLTRIDVAAGTHAISAASDTPPALSEGTTRDLSTTYCRRVLAEDAVLAVRDAPQEGWKDDPAYDTFGFSTYLGTKVVTGEELYGTLCFGGRRARETPFGPEEAAAATLLARAAGRLLNEEREAQSSRPTAAQLEALFEHSPNMINIHDAEGTLLVPNPRLCEETGYSADELTGMKVWELDREVTPENARAQWASMEPGDRFRWEGTYRRADGSTFPVEVDLRCLDMEGGSRFIATGRDVTEQKKAERERRDTKQLLETTFESLSEAVLVVDPSEREIVTCNSAVEEVFGYEKDELIGECTEKLHTSPEAYERFGDLSEAALQERGFFRHEYRMQRKDGRVIDTEHVVTPLQGERWPEGVVSVVRDITERKGRKRELEEMQERIRLTLEETDSLIFEIDFETGEVQRHGSFERFFNLPSDEVPTWEEHLDRAVHPEDRSALRDFYRGLAEGVREGGEIEYRTNPAFGDVRWIRDTVHVDDSGPRRLLGLAQDVTDRKETARALREERDLLNRILEVSPTAIAVFDTDGAFIEASGQAEDILGLEKEEITDRTYNDPAWHIRGPDGGPMPDEELPFARVMRTEAPVYGVEHTIVWPDGTERLLSVSGAPLYSAEDELEGAVFHIDDITEQRAAEEALREERDRFATLFRNLPTPVVHGRPNEEGAIEVQAVNERFEAVFGYEEGDIRGEDLQGLIVPDAEEGVADAMRWQLLEGEPVNREVRRWTAEGLRDFRLQVALRKQGDTPTEGFAIYTDVTERKERERRLARRRALLEAQAEATIDGLLVVDNDRRVIFYNDKFLDIWNLSEELVGGDAGETVHERAFLEKAADLLPNFDTFRREVEYLYDHPHEKSRDLIHLTDGRWLDRYSAPIVGEEGTHFGRLWVFRDVTEQRRMLERLLEVQEEERRRIDREIHDEMGGLLTSLQFTIDLARRKARESGAPTDPFDQLEELVSDLSSVSRTISRKLYPSDLSEHGLNEGLASLVDEVRRDRDLEIDFYSELGSEDRFATIIERTVYWVVQETVMDIARRAEADAAQIIVSKRGKRLYVHLFDEGVQGNWSSRDRGGRFRLEAIRRRVEWLDGEVRIDAIPDEGTRLSVVLPVRLPYLVG